MSLVSPVLRELFRGDVWKAFDLERALKSVLPAFLDLDDCLACQLSKANPPV